MRMALFAFLIASALVPAAAQVSPSPTAQSPRIQEVQWQANIPVTLTTLPESHLTVLLEPGQVIQRARISDSQAWKVSIAKDQDGLTILPKKGARPANLTVETLTRTYRFRLETAQTLLAAYLVRFVPAEAPAEETTEQARDTLDPEAPKFGYRVRGDRAVRPKAIADDGRITIIEYGPEQALPAVFAVGPTGKEQVVDGYMRGERFVIDRVHRELVFRIDKEKATAKRNKEAEVQP
jgi:type IV secretion system protein VirB9